MKAKQTVKSVKSAPKKSPAPAWMEDELRSPFEMMTPDERIARAEKLESTAAQLREMKPARVENICTVEIGIRPNQKKALLALFERHGSKKEESEHNKLTVCARWVLETGLTMLPQISDQTDRFAYYRDSEGLEDSTYCEQLTAASLEKFEIKSEARDAED